MRIEFFDKDGNMKKYMDVIKEVRKAYFEELISAEFTMDEMAEEAGMEISVLRRRLMYSGLISGYKHIGVKNVHS